MGAGGPSPWASTSLSSPSVMPTALNSHILEHSTLLDSSYMTPTAAFEIPGPGSTVVTPGEQAGKSCREQAGPDDS